MFQLAAQMSWQRWHGLVASRQNDGLVRVTDMEDLGFSLSMVGFEFVPLLGNQLFDAFGAFISNRFK